MKIYFDCTFTHYSGLNTGIQRVVRNIISRQQLYKDKFNAETVPVISFDGHYYEIEREFILNIRPVTASIGEKIKSLFDRIRNYTLRKFKSHSKTHGFVIKCFLVLEYLFKKLFWVIKSIRVFRTVLISGYKKVKFDKTDSLVLLDAFWTYDLVHSIDNSGLDQSQVVSVIYDLIPMTHPDFVENEGKELFIKKIPDLARKVRRYIGISKLVSEELQNYLTNHFPENKYQVDFFLLGSDFKPRVLKEEILLRPQYKNHFESGPVWLVVGTIEPRKNHTFILNAFEEIWKSGGKDKLLIIGRIGWKCEEILNRFQNHKELNDNLFVYVDANDEELAYAYNHAEGLIFASFVEGFGLPIVEAMASGIKVLCSDIPVFREVGGNYPHYFQLNNSKELLQKINDTRGLKQTNKKKWLTWDESAIHLFEKVISK